MKGRPEIYFLDTNIFIYSLEISNKKKCKIATDLVTNALERECGIISGQVAQEFINIALKKFERTLNGFQMNIYLLEVLRPLCKVHTDINLISEAINIKEYMKISYYDALIISAALKHRCSILYSEDLQHGREIQGMTIINPF